MSNDNNSLGNISSGDERRMVENEVVFRQANEKVAGGLDSLSKLAAHEGQSELAPSKDMAIQFFCECSDENCRERISLTLDNYRRHHENKKRFIVKSGHEVPEIEFIIATFTDHVVVEKRIQPPKEADSFNKTDVDNS